MTDYSDLVKALRCCATMTCKGDECKYMILGCHDCFSKLHDDAADAIEALQAAEPTENQVVDYCHKRCLVVLGADLFHELKASYGKLPKRGKWIGVNPMVDTVQCSICGGQLFSAELETPYCPYCGAKMEDA